MDTLQETGDSLFSSPDLLFYFGGILLAVVLFFLARYLRTLDGWFSKLSHVVPPFVEKPWHVAWSFVLGVAFFFTQLISRGEAERFNQEYFKVFFNEPHFWDWFWLLLFLVEIGMMLAVLIRSIRQFGQRFGWMRAFILILLMGIYFLSGFYMGLAVAAVIAFYIIYRSYKMFYGRKKGLLTS